MAKKFFSQKGIQYQEKDVSRDQAAAVEMIQRSGQQGVPVIAIDGETIVGFDRGRLEQILSQPPRPKVSLGAAVAGAETVARKKGAFMPPGAYIGKVNAGSAADKAGLHEGDVIVSVNGVDIRGSGDLQRVLSSLNPGQTVDIVFWRNGREIRHKLPL